MARRFRFGVNLTSITDGAAWSATCRRAESLGFDVLMVADHLGMPAPFPALVAAAAATERVRLGTFVLNAGFWNPALLAREVATVDQLTGGRLEVGLGTGYVRSEFDAAGLAWESAGARVDRLTDLVTGLDAHLTDEQHTPAPAQRPRPPLLLGGHGRRMLGLAAAHGDIAAFTGATLVPGSTTGTLHLVSATELDDRVAHLASRAGARAGEIESNILVQMVTITDDRRGTLDALRAEHGLDYLSTDELLDLPTLLVGTVGQIADQLRGHRERFGFSYVTILEPFMEAFAPVIGELTEDHAVRHGGAV